MTDLPDSLVSYLPTSKFDIQSIEHLREIPFDLVRPLLPHLLTWLQDSNWPIAKRMATYLLMFRHEIIPEIKWVLEGNDDRWKYNCITGILHELPHDVVKPLFPVLERIAYHPSPSEMEEDVHEVARECLQHWTTMKGS